MPRPPIELDDTQKQLLRQLVTAGHGVRSIAEALGVGRSTAARLVREAQIAPSAPGRQPIAVAADGPRDLVVLLERAVTALEEALARSAAAGDTASLSTLTRTLNTTVAQLARLRPPPPVQPDTMPDMVAAAERCREKLRGMLERAPAVREALADLGICPECRRPMAGGGES